MNKDNSTKQLSEADIQLSTDVKLSISIENLMVEKNLRGMKVVQPLLTPGYFVRAALLLVPIKGTILIGTGFPVSDTFETDGPVGAIALYNALTTLGANPILVCGGPLYSAIKNDFNCIELKVGNLDSAKQETTAILEKTKPDAVISIERPGLSKDGRYYNMRGEDISDKCACFDYFVEHLSLAKSDVNNCRTIGIGDGGNEIGMGNIASQLSNLTAEQLGTGRYKIIPSHTKCDELLIADVSNWAAYGIIFFLEKWSGIALLSATKPKQIIEYLSQNGSVDGVTRKNTITEDGLCYSQGEAIISTLKNWLN